MAYRHGSGVAWQAAAENRRRNGSISAAASGMLRMFDMTASPAQRAWQQHQSAHRKLA